MSFIQQIQEERLNRKLIDEIREEGSGIRNLLTELYPDNAHFIYELLQNAEDAQATKATFALSSNELIFRHNGKRQFTHDDIVSITSIAQSTKKDDFNQIGKFGIGFKAVFSYTQTPKIYSGQYAFEILNLICPSEISDEQEIRQANIEDGSTLFKFPFNHIQKPKEKAFEEIESTLLGLSDNTILFLRNIEEISWEITQPDKQNHDGYIRRQLEKNHFVIEKKLVDIERSYWLRFDKNIPDKESLFVSLAFRLINASEADKLFKIDSKVAKADVSIFFPAEKENSGLKFYLHAPFAATVARDSIQNSRENENLRDLLVQLLIESLPQIKESELLDSNFLSVLPNKKDSLSSFYQPFREALISAFQTQNFTPTWQEEFSPAEKLRQTSREAKEIVNRETILSHLVESEDIDWSINAQKGSRTYDFLESLNIKDFSWEELLKKVSTVFSSKEKANEILSNFSDEWLQSFYILLGKAKEETHGRYDWRLPKIEDSYIVRLQDRHYNMGKNTYFQTELLKRHENLSIVKPETYQSSKDKNTNEKAKAFLSSIGVKEFEPKDEIKIILERHYKDFTEGHYKDFTEEEHIKHLKKFIRFGKEYAGETLIFRDYYILRTENEDKHTHYYSKPFEVFIDEPYEKTLLSNIESFLNKNGKWKLWLGYQNQINNQEDFVSFLKAVDATFKLKIEKVKIVGNPSQSDLKQDIILRRASETRNSTNEDYKINNLESLLAERNYGASQIIWETISKADKKVLKARYCPNSHYQIRTAPSQLIHTLKQFSWIPDRESNFYKPEDITREMLPDDFPFDNRNGWLEEIGVGTQAQKNKLDEQQKIERVAKQLGFESAEEVERAKEWIKMSDEERKEFEEFRQQRAKRRQNDANEIIKTEVEDNSHQIEVDLTFDKRLIEENIESNPTENIVKYFESALNLSEKDEDHSQKLREKVIEIVNEESSKTTYLKEPEVEREQIVISRVGQSFFRENLERIEDKCRLTSVKDKRFLIASHIKPWNKCDTAKEKIDGNNGLLLSPHVDKLFDKGWISFTDDGKILCLNDEVREIMKLWNLDISKPVGSFNNEQKKYLAYHRKLFNFES